MLVLFLANRYIRAVQGKVTGKKFRIDRACQTIDTHGCILNGTVTDEEGFLILLKKFWEENRLPRKNIVLVVGGSQFTSRVTEVPKIKENRILEYIGREFSDVERMEDPVNGYFRLPARKGESKKTQRMFAMAAPRAYLEEYRERFRKIGVTIAEIRSVAGALIRLIEYPAQMKKATGILQYVDDIMLFNLLIVNGEYRYSSTNRLYSDPDTPAYPVEVARAASNMLQFARTQGIGDELNAIFVTGLAKEDLQIYFDSMVQIAPELSAQELDLHSVVRIKKTGTESFSSGFAALLGGFIPTDRKTNVVYNLKRDLQKEAAGRKRRKVLIPLVLFVLISGAATGMTAWKQNRLKTKLAEVQAYNNNPSILAACARYDTLEEEIRLLGQLETALIDLNARVMSYPRVDTATEKTVSASAQELVTAVISSYSAKTGILSFDTAAADVNQIHRFAELLGRKSIFDSVDYTGYSQDSDGLWHVKINAVMAGREEAVREADR